MHADLTAKSTDWTPLKVLLALSGIASLWIPVLVLHLTPALFAALITYSGTRGIAQALHRRWPAVRHVQFVALAIMVLIIAVLVGVLADWTADVADGNAYMALWQKVVDGLEKMCSALPAWISHHVPQSLEAIQASMTHWVRDHGSEVKLWGGHTVRGLGHTVVGAVIGGIMAIQLPVTHSSAVRGTGTSSALDRMSDEPGSGESDHDRHGLSPVSDNEGSQAATMAAGQPLAQALRNGFDRLVGSFTAVVFAQFRIALINAALTGLYLLVILPLIGSPLPLAKTMVAVTFVCGLVPIVGNLVSNTVVVGVSLTHSAGIALLSLAWLVVIHKFEYFLNAHIIGSHISAKAWELLIVMLVLESIFGISGLICAPIIYAQAKQSFVSRGWL